MDEQAHPMDIEQAEAEQARSRQQRETTISLTCCYLVLECARDQRSRGEDDSLRRQLGMV